MPREAAGAAAVEGGDYTPPDIAESEEKYADQIRASEENNDVVGEETNYVSPEPPTPDLVQACRELLEREPDDLACRAIEAKAAGELKPGEYSRNELDAALAEAPD